MVNLPESKERILSKQQDERAIFNQLFQFLFINTVFEVQGMLKREGVQENNSLRARLKNLATHLHIEEELGGEKGLRVGIADFIPDGLLEKWAAGEELPTYATAGFQKTARYFLEKKRASETESHPS